jgi:SAM-dependent methyltransferase
MARQAEIDTAFRLLLGRPPTAVEAGQWAAIAPDALRERLMATEAFAAALPAGAVRMMEEPSGAIEWHAAPAQAAALLDRVQAHWTRLGEERPHWSVAAQPAFLPDQIDANREAFAASGMQDVAALMATLARHGLHPRKLPRAVDFGCGVGRMTRPMASVFTEVTGCDVSPSHLALARVACGPGVRFSLVNTADFGMGGPFDLWFSTRTLQHNPPPVMALILRRAFSLLAPGGVAVFQIPTARVGYAFSAAAALAAPDADEALPIHVLPQAAVFALAHAAGCVPLEVLEDAMIWPPPLCRSNSFLIQKSPG